jgi:CHAT domain-containing protein/tetratricopeptide (TPR) repeat protein
MDVALLAEQLAVDRSNHATHLAERDQQVDVALAVALRAFYLEQVGANPGRAANAAAALGALAGLTHNQQAQALAEWTCGLAALQLEGQIEQAITLIDAAAARFAVLADEHSVAETQVSKVYALAMLGRYDQAITTGERARDMLLAHGDRLAAGRVEQNLGNIHHRRDHYEAAAAHYEAARTHFTAAGDERLLAYAENGLANILALQHRFGEAAQLYEQALERAVATNAELTRAEIECNLGCLALFQGRYDQALDYLERSRHRYAALDMPHQVLLAELELADAYLEVNLLDEATAIYARITPRLAALGMRAEQARATSNHGRAAVAAGRLDEGRALMADANALYTAEGNEVGVALTALTNAQLALAAGENDKAAALALAAERTLNELGAWGNLLLARWLRGEAARRQQHWHAARNLLEATLHQAETHGVPQIARRCHTSLGQLLAACEQLAQAEAALQRAVQITETMRSPLRAEAVRVAFVADKLAPYGELVRLCLQAGDARSLDALDYVERARARALLDVLPEPLAHTVAGPAEDAALLAERTSIHQELNWLYSQINRLADAEPQPDAAAVARLYRAILEREARLHTLELRSSGLARADTSATGFDLAALTRVLGVDAALVEYYAIDDELLAFVIVEGDVRVVRGLASMRAIGTALDQLQFQLGALQHDPARLRAHSNQLTQRVRRHLGALYDMLVRPFEEMLGNRRLVIAPHRELYYVPFHALFDGQRAVIERRAVSYTPSARVLEHCAGREPRPIKRALLVGVSDARTPRLRDEVTALAGLFDTPEVLVDGDATLAALRARAPHVDLLHLACHGQFRPDSPLFSALQLADGRLTVRDAAALHLRCELAVLSACETGVSSVAPGDEVLGLARGFLAAGAPALVVSMWTVDDSTAAELMERFHRRMCSGMGAAEALRCAQQAAMERTPHPFFWAPFFLLGRP